MIALFYLHHLVNLLISKTLKVIVKTSKYLIGLCFSGKFELQFPIHFTNFSQIPPDLDLGFELAETGFSKLSVWF